MWVQVCGKAPGWQVKWKRTDPSAAGLCSGEAMLKSGAMESVDYCDSCMLTERGVGTARPTEHLFPPMLKNNTNLLCSSAGLKTRGLCRGHRGVTRDLLVLISLVIHVLMFVLAVFLSCLCRRRSFEMKAKIMRRCRHTYFSMGASALHDVYGWAC